ncbi:aminoacyl--tRNA ligase-related protein [Kitasatospora sp. NPDC086801]|uniref:aminoacyl--tRNA ligase-related protein n=1 Tax=Kitasatospora sp. NPDC086801 TaxID=3364066 RepID=UPI00381793C9
MKETGIPGAPALGPAFERTVAELQAALTATAGTGPGPTWYPPLMSAARIEQAEYAESFPHLLGTVHAYAPERSAQRGEPVGARPATDVVLAPAVCYNVYAELAGQRLEEQVVLDAAGYCYRHEATSETGRFRSFRMREFVALGPPEQSADWRDAWIPRCEAFLGGLGLDVEVVSATDPFFGPGGRLMRSTQLEQGLKYEFVAKLTADDPGTAIASANRHRDHLGRRFDIHHGEDVAHSSCVAFGLERITLALVHAHGEDRRNWPRITAPDAPTAV